MYRQGPQPTVAGGRGPTAPPSGGSNPTLRLPPLKPRPGPARATWRARLYRRGEGRPPPPPTLPRPMPRTRTVQGGGKFACTPLDTPPLHVLNTNQYITLTLFVTFARFLALQYCSFACLGQKKISFCQVWGHVTLVLIHRQKDLICTCLLTYTVHLGISYTIVTSLRIR